MLERLPRYLSLPNKAEEIKAGTYCTKNKAYNSLPKLNNQAPTYANPHLVSIIPQILPLTYTSGTISCGQLTHQLACQI